MLTVRLLCVGNLKEKYWRDAYAEYEKRLSRFCKLETVEISESDPEKEGAEILKKISGYAVALCIEGKELSSTEFSAFIEKKSFDFSKITFMIGGSDGLSQAVKDAAAFKFSFSPMTFPHQLMKVLFAEQLYRAFTISNNITYHK